MKPAAPYQVVSVLIAALLPIVLTSGYFLWDVPNHLFRSQLIIDLARGKASSFYYFELKLIPNLAVDAASLLLSPIANGTAVVASLTVIACAGFYLGILQWRRIGRRSTSFWLCLLIALDLYSMPLSMGLINYLVGLALFFVCAGRLDRANDETAVEFWLPQATLLLLMYFCSIFPVLIYFVWAGALAAFDLWRSEPAQRLALIGRKALVNGPILVVVGLLVLLVRPEFPLEGADQTRWTLDGKLQGLSFLGRMFNLPHEFVFAFVLLGTVIGIVWIGWLRLEARHAVGLIALLIGFLALPTEIQGARLVDSRLPMAIVGILFATAREMPARASRLALLARVIIVFLACVRVIDVPMVWSAEARALRSYVEIAQRIPERSMVAFVYYSADTDPAHRVPEWIESWKRAREFDDLLGPRSIHLFTEHGHLHMAPFAGRDVFLSNMFPNFTVLPKQGLKFRRTIVPFEWFRVAGILAEDPYDFVISHEDLGRLEVRGKCLCLVARDGDVRLYHLHKAQGGPDGALPTCGCSEMAGGCGAVLADPSG